MNDFKVMIQAVLDKVKTLANIKKDIKEIQPKIPPVKLTGELNESKTTANINKATKKIKPKISIDADTSKLDKTLEKSLKKKRSIKITPSVDSTEFSKSSKEVEKQSQTLFSKLSNNIAGLDITRRVLQEFINSVKNAIGNVKELNRISTDVQMASGATKSETDGLMSSYYSLAKEISSTTKATAENANTFIRMGESLRDTNTLIKNSQMLSKIGMIENADSADYLISMMKGYQVAARDSISIVDKLTSVDMSAAVSAGGLAQAMSRVSNIANNSGTSMDRLIGYIATVGEVTQKSMSEVGNSFQSIYSRMNNIKIGKFIDDETGEDLSDTEAVLGKIGIKLRENESTYRDFDNVLDDVGQNWRKFNKVEQNSIAVAIAGTRQRENFTALMNNYGSALEYAGIAANSAGTALKRYEVYQDSLEAKTNQLTNAFEGLSVNLIDDDTYAGILDATTALVEFIDKTNLLKGTLAGVATAGILSAFSSIATGAVTAAKSAAHLTSVMAMFNDGMSIKNLKEIGEACIGLSDKQLKLVLSMKGLSDAKRETILQGMKLNKTQAAEKLSTLGFANAEKVAEGATFSFAGALNTLKTAFASNPIGMSIMTLTAIVSGATMAFSYHKQKQEEALRVAQDAANTYADTSKSVKDYTKRYEELHQALIEAKGNEEDTYNVKKQLLDLQTELNEKFGDEYGKLNLVTDAYKDQTDAIKAFNKESANRFLNETPGLEAAESEMTRDRDYFLGSTGNMNEQYAKDIYDIVSRYQDKGIELEKLADKNIPGYTIKFVGDATQANEVINELETEMRNLQDKYSNNNFVNSIVENSKNRLVENNKVITAQGKQYEEKLKAEIFSNDALSNSYNDMLQSVKDYNEAILKSEDPFIDEKVKSAYRHLNEIKAGVEDNESVWGKYSSIINDVFDQADTKFLDFTHDLSSTDYSNMMDTLRGKSDIEAKALIDVNEGDFYKELISLADEYSMSIDDVISNLQKMGIVAKTVAQETKELPKAFTKTEMISAINGLSEGFESLDKIMSSIKGKNPFDYSLLDDKNFKETFSGLGNAYTDFIEQISNSPKDINSCQSAFNNLVSEWIKSTGILDQVSDSTASLTTMMLKMMGVTNAEEVVTKALVNNHNRLAAEKYYNATASAALEGATVNEISRIIEEGVQAGITEGALIKLVAEKIIANSTTLSTNGDIENLKALAAQAGLTASAIAQFKTGADGVAGSAGAGKGRLYSNNPEKAKHDLLNSINDAVDANFGTGNTPNTTYGGGTKTNKSGSGSKDKTKEPTIFDFMQNKVDKLDNTIEQLQDQVDTFISSVDKNNTTDTIVDQMIEKMSILQQMHDKYMEEAAKVGLAQEYIDKIQNGTMNQDAIARISDENLVKQIQEYEKWYKSATDTNDKIVETRKNIEKLNLSKLDNIKNQFDNILGAQNDLIDAQKQYLDLRESMGEEIYADDYADLINLQGELVNKNAEAYNRLANEMSKINLEKGSDEWYKYNEELQKYKNNMMSAASAVKEYMNAIVELEFKGLNDFKSQMDSISNTISTMSDLIGNVGLTDEKGKLTDLGLAKMALYAQQLANSKQEAAEYAEAMNALKDMLDEGLLTQDEYNKRLQDYTSAQNSAVQSTKEAKDAILSLVKDGIQAEIDAKKKLVDETKAALDAERDLHDYQNSISEKQDNISKLERQIAALSNSTNREDIAQRLQLQSQLAEAKKELYELQYDHEIDQRKEALDKEFNDYEESKQKESDELDSNLDAQNAAIEQYLNEIKTKYSTVYGVLNQYGDEYSLAAIEDLTTPWNEGGNAADLCSVAVGDALSNIQYNIDSMDFSRLYEMVDLFNSLGMSNGIGSSGGGDFEDISGQGRWQKGQGGRDWFGENYNPDGDYFYASDGIYTINGKQYGFDEDGYMQTEWQEHDGKQYYFDANDGHMVKSKWIPGKGGSQYYLLADGTMAEDMAIKGNDGSYYYVDDDGKWDGDTLTAEQVRKLGYTIGYKKGRKCIPHDQLAWTQENKPELITRPSDGALLTPLKLGDGVINGDLTQNLLDIAGNPNRFVEDIVARSMPNYKIPDYEIHPVNREQKIEVNMNIGGVLDETAARVLSDRMPEMLKKNHMQITKQVWKDTEYGMMGK